MSYEIPWTTSARIGQTGLFYARLEQIAYHLTTTYLGEKKVRVDSADRMTFSHQISLQQSLDASLADPA